MILFWIVPLTVRVNGALPLWKLLIACARVPRNVLPLMSNVRLVEALLVETSTPTLVLVNVAPGTLAVMLVPPELALTPVPTVGAGGLAGFGVFPVKLPPVTVSPMFEVPVPRKLNRLPCGELPLPLIGAPLLETVLLRNWKLVSVPDELAICISNSLLLLITELEIEVGREPPEADPVTWVRLMPDSS